MIGAPFMLPFNLAKAISEPAKVMIPMATPRLISTRLCALINPVQAPLVSSWQMPKDFGE